MRLETIGGFGGPSPTVTNLQAPFGDGIKSKAKTTTDNARYLTWDLWLRLICTEVAQTVP